jgi:hypothetical protein
LDVRHDGRRASYSGKVLVPTELLASVIDALRERESALRKLADEIREEDAKICESRIPKRPRWPMWCDQYSEDERCAAAIRAKKTKPPSEVEPE